MALRATNHQNRIGSENQGPVKVETKVVQGPVLRRAALGDVGNRSIPNQVSKVGEAVKKTVASKSLIASKPTTSTVPKNAAGKENKPSTKPQIKVEHMEVEEVEIKELSQAFSTQCLNVQDIDANDGDNPQLVSEYVNDIYQHLRFLEDKYKVLPKFLEGQVITGKMRAILIDWLIQVHVRFNLLQETLYLTVAIIDRYLQIEKKTAREKLQLVGVTAMFIASKYEEMYCPEVGDFAYITDKAYTKAEIRRMEVKMLTALECYISFPLPLHFLRRNSKAGSVDAAQHNLAKYLMELCLPEYTMCHYRPSLIAAAALCFSLKLLGDESVWDDTLTFYSNYAEDKLKPIVCKMAAIIIKSQSSKQQAVRSKYRSSKCMKISEIPQLKSRLVETLAKKAGLSSGTPK